MENLIAVILGWLLGILGQRPIGYIQNSFKRSSLRKSIFAELSELNCHLAMLSYLLFLRIGKIDREYLLWVQSIIKSYHGFYSYLNLSEPIDKLLNTEEMESLKA